MVDASTYSKLKSVGGLKGAMECYGAGKISLSDLAKVAGVTREALRQRIIREIGRDALRNLISSRKRHLAEEYNIKHKKEFTTQHEAIRFLELNLNENKLNKSILNLIQKKLFAGITKIGLKFPSLVKLVLDDSVNVIVRSAIISQSCRDFESGYYRFNIKSCILDYDIAIFNVVNDLSSVVYVFNSSQIATVKSLTLRFKDATGGKRYADALENWETLRRKIKHAK